MCVGLNRDPAGAEDWLRPPYIEGIVFAQARDVDGHCTRIAASEPLRRGRGVVNLVGSRSRSHRSSSISSFNTSVVADRMAGKMLRNRKKRTEASNRVAVPSDRAGRRSVEIRIVFAASSVRTACLLTARAQVGYVVL